MLPSSDNQEFIFLLNVSAKGKNTTQNLGSKAVIIMEQPAAHQSPVHDLQNYIARSILHRIVLRVVHGQVVFLFSDPDMGMIYPGQSADGEIL